MTRVTQGLFKLLFAVAFFFLSACDTKAIKSDGSVVGWGDNTNGRITIPAAASSDVVAVSAGSGFSLALKNDGSVVAWGNNTGNQTNVPTNLIVAIP